MLFELLLGASVGKRSSSEVGEALPDGQIQPLDERSVQCRGVLGFVEHIVEAPYGSMNGSSFDLHDAIVPSRLEDLAIESRGAENATDDLLVETESVGDDQEKTVKIHAVGNIAQEGKGVPVASTSDDGRGPETRPDLHRDEDPRRIRFAA